MQELQNLGQHIEQDLLRAAAERLVAAVEAGLGQLDVPVAVVVPDKVIDLARGHAQLKVVHVLADFLHHVVQAGEDPLVLQLKGLGQLVLLNGEVHHHEARSVPELVAEVAHGFALFNVEAHVVSGGIAGDEVEAQGVGAVAVDHIQRVDAVAEGFGHLPAEAVADQTVNEDGLEGLLMHLLHAGEDHAGNPEEDDVIAGDHDAGGIPEVEVGGLFRPAHRGEGPERGGEPGVQNIFFAMDVLTAAVGAAGGVLAGDRDLAAVVAVPGRNLMAPPELAGNAPVVDVLHPVEIGLGEALGDELDAAVLHHVDGGLGQRLHLHKPLGAGEGLHHVAAAVAAADVVAVGLDLDEVALLFQILHNGFAALIAVHAVVLAAVDDLRVLVDALNLLQIVAQADFIVVRIVAGGHLDRAGAEAQLDVLVRNDGQFPSHQRENGVLAHQVLVALVIRMDGDAGVAQHRLGTGGGDDELLIRVLDRVADVPEVTGHVLVLNLGVGERRAAVGAPVDDAAALIDQALVIELAERLTHGPGAYLVHGEAVALPVAGGAETLLLLDDAVAVLVLPVPDALEELLASQVIAGQTFVLAQLFFHADLGGNAGVILTGQPQRGIALHALIAGKDILQRAVQGMAHVELAGDVGRRHDDGERLFLLIPDAPEEAALFPEVIDLRLHGMRIVHFRQFFHGSFTPKSKSAPKQNASGRRNRGTT